MQTHSDYVIGDKLKQNIWRNHEGWARTIPIANGVPQWKSASAWAGPWNISALAGSGTLQAQSDYVINNTLHQNYWRNNRNYVRTVPIVNGAEQWGQASAWSGPFPINGLPNCGGGEGIDLPGCGNMEMLADYVLNGSLHQEYWRGGSGYRRTVPIVGDAPQWGAASGWDGAGSLPGSGSLQTLNFYPLP